LKNVPAVESIQDTSYLAAAFKKGGADAASTKTAVVPQIPKDAGTKPTAQISNKKLYINFETGRAVFGGNSKGTLEQLKRDLLIASNTLVEIHGHTDNQGDPTKNMQLSEQRAFAVKQWLETQAKTNFPEGRIKIISHGQQEPVAPNATEEGRAKNRRVEVILKANN
jgi:OmpA-OmpF porin, OOP family